ncbi:MAG: GIY-YIG nuclease family protein [Candidatus Omnitrophota bacterium]
MEKRYYVYILANHKNGTLYIGITSNIIKRIWEHKDKAVKGFTSRYGVDKLVYLEEFSDPENAIRREKRLKKYSRQWKLNLIERQNSNWDDLYENFVSGLPEQVGQ